MKQNIFSFIGCKAYDMNWEIPSCRKFPAQLTLLGYIRICLDLFSSYIYSTQ